MKENGKVYTTGTQSSKVLLLGAILLVQLEDHALDGVGLDQQHPNQLVGACQEWSVGMPVCLHRLEEVLAQAAGLLHQC